MAGPKRTTSPKGRFYTWRGENYHSVTTILGGGIPKPVLINWAKKYTAEYAVDHLDTLTALVADDRQGAVDWLKGAAYRERDKAGDLGTAVHEWIEAHRLGKPMPTVPLPVKPYLVAFEQFLSDFEPDYHMVEAPIFNKTERYAGTLDAIVRLRLPLEEDARDFVLDAKTGKGIYPEAALQCCAYARAEFVGAADGSEQKMPSVSGAVALHLAPAGYRLIELDISDRVWDAFRFVREVYRWTIETSKDVLGAEYGNAAQNVQEVIA